jgi:hypothetical protein
LTAYAKPVCASRSPRRSARSVRAPARGRFGQRAARSVSCARLPRRSSGGCRAPRRRRARLASPLAGGALAPRQPRRAGRDHAPPAPPRAVVPSGRSPSARARQRQRARPPLQLGAVLARPVARVHRGQPRPVLSLRSCSANTRKAEQRSPKSTAVGFAWHPAAGELEHLLHVAAALAVPHPHRRIVAGAGQMAPVARERHP